MKQALLILLASTAVLSAQLIPTARLRDWTPGNNVGVIGGIPTTRPIGVTFAGDNTGVNDVTAALQNAINSTPAGTVCFVPAGIYKISGTISLPNNMTLRGAGMNSTIFRQSAGQFAMNSGLYQPFDQPAGAGFVVATGGKAAGSTAVTVADASGFVANNNMMLSAADNPGQFDNPVTIGGGRTRMQVVRLTSKVGNTLNFWPPLTSDWSAVEVKVADMDNQPSGPKINIGMESFTIEWPITAGVGTMLNMSDTYNCWLKEVRFINSTSKTIHMSRAVNCEFRRCYLDAQNRGSGSNGSGLLWEWGSSGVLFEDNIIITSFPGIEMNFGARGNVIAYNFFLMEHNDQLPPTLALDVNHGAHNEFNLFEGNILQTVQADGYFGSVSTQLFYRNWVTGWMPGLFPTIIYTIACKRFSRDITVVGNILNHPQHFTAGDDGTSFGYPHIGNNDFVGHAPPWADWKQLILPGGYHEFDDGVLATLVRKVNYAYGAIPQGIPAGEARGANPFPDSLFRTSKPTYFGTLTWPPFNPEAPGNLNDPVGYTRIPAGYRYINGTEVPPSGADTTPPTLVTKVIQASGTQLVLTFNEAVTGSSTGLALNMNGGPAGLTYTSGAGSSTITYNITGRVIGSHETGTIAYTQPGNGIEDTAGNDLASFPATTVTNSSTVDLVAPTPNPMTFSSNPTAVDAFSVTMQATLATDSQTPAGITYLFDETSGAPGGQDSGWQSSRTYIDSGLSPNTQYTYRVKARDAFLNETTLSSAASATTETTTGPGTVSIDTLNVTNLRVGQ